jgi:hypothetical protein
MTVNKIDKAALELAIELKLRDKDQTEVAQIKDMFADRTRTWTEVAEFAAYSCQIAALQLKRWQNPPCVCDGEGDEPGDRLLRRMLAAGVSQFDPDPLAAVSKTKHEAGVL